jgi:type IV pilus assembly protein PilY1
VGAYGGDLKGNLWKFDLTGATSNWSVGLSGNALYAAGATQPITATPAVLPHPNGGYVVSFGTGKFFENADKDAPYATQRLYGIWDKHPFGSATVAPAGSWISGVSQLVAQTITTVPVGTPPVNFFRVSTNAVGWGNGVNGIRGWYIDLPNQGQRVAYPVERLSGTFIMASTLSPVSSAAADLCVQTGSGSGWVYVIDGVTGSGPTKPTLNTNGDTVINESDAVVSGWQDPVDGRPTSITIERTATLDKLCIETAQSTCTRIDLACGQLGANLCPSDHTGGNANGFTGGIKSREWRQLFMR